MGYPPTLSEMFISEMNFSESINYIDETRKYDEISDEYSLFSEETSCCEDEEEGEEDLSADDIYDCVDDEMTVSGSNNDPLSMYSSDATSPNYICKIAERADERAMNSNQEVWNALTMLIAPCYCLYFLLSGHWMTATDVGDFSSDYIDNLGRYDGCIQSSIFPRIHAMPPLTIIAIVTGMVLHAPASVLYHLLCAFRIPQGPKRINHWSRRLDQAMIHIVSILWTFGSSGQIRFTLLSLALNIDSIIGLYRRPFCPRKIFHRFAAAIVIQTLPLIINGELDLFLRLLVVYIVSGWVFKKYPLGGYSHGVFHILIAFAPPLVLAAAGKLPTAQNGLRLAAQCAFSKQLKL